METFICIGYSPEAEPHPSQSFHRDLVEVRPPSLAFPREGRRLAGLLVQ